MAFSTFQTPPSPLEAAASSATALSLSLSAVNPSDVGRGCSPPAAVTPHATTSFGGHAGEANEEPPTQGR